MQINIHTQEVGIQEVLNLNLSPKSSSYNWSLFSTVKPRDALSIQFIKN
jgi:hypothetical protein